MIKNWYAVYTKPQQEQKVAAVLAKKGIDAYCPLTRIGVYTGFGKKTNWQPLFPSFVFVHITEAQFAAIRQANDVINFMYWLGRPAMIPEAEIKSVQQFTSVYSNLKVEKTSIVRNAVPVRNESIEDSLGDTATTQKIKIKLSLPSLGFTLIAMAEKPAGVVDFTYERN